MPYYTTPNGATAPGGYVQYYYTPSGAISSYTATSNGYSTYGGSPSYSGGYTAYSGYPGYSGGYPTSSYAGGTYGYS